MRLLILAAQPLVRAGLRHTLQCGVGLTIVGECGTVTEAVALVGTEHPDIVLLDPDSDGIRLRAVSVIGHVAACPIVVVTSSTDVNVLARAIEFGASGIISKDQSVDLLLRAVQKVCAGEVWLDRAKTASVLRSVMHRNNDPESVKIGALTKREREVVTLVGEGLRNLAIAERLFISEATVRNHLTSILGKLGLSDRFDLAVYAYRHGLADNDAAMVDVAAASQ